MDSEMQFGDVEETRPQPRLRPDRNKHYATATCGELREDDIPIYVDLDVMLDMEAHALSDTNVELGGVMLGGQFEDADGRPFVVVSDSLRATHYESTRGSFKFTHDTWSEISRQRDEFPDDLGMVGWYHTHPDWGVFLSGMDMFICDNFFNRPLDLALVIDPCRDDRGMFQWTGNPRDRIRRSGGFVLISSRFRREELEFHAAQLEGRIEMSSDPRTRGFSAMQHTPPTVVNIADTKSPWQGIAVLGMLSTQFLLLALIAWRILLPAGMPAAPATGGNDARAERRMLDRIVGDLKVAPDGLVTELTEQRRSNDELRAANLGLHAQIVVLRDDNEDAAGRIANLLKKQESMQADLVALRTDTKDQRTQIRSLETELKEAGGSVAATDWTLYIVGGVLVVLLGAGIAVALGMRNPMNPQPQEDMASDTSSESPQEKRSSEKDGEESGEEPSRSDE